VSEPLTTNPERLWAFHATSRRTRTRTWFVTGEGLAKAECMRSLEEERMRADDPERRSPIQEYIRAEISEDGWSRFRQACARADALRQERDEWEALAKRAAELLRPTFCLTVEGRHSPKNALVRDIDAALESAARRRL
jgi:hypothetical protein